VKTIIRGDTEAWGHLRKWLLELYTRPPQRRIKRKIHLTASAACGGRLRLGGNVKQKSLNERGTLASDNQLQHDPEGGVILYQLD